MPGAPRMEEGGGVQEKWPITEQPGIAPISLSALKRASPSTGTMNINIISTFFFVLIHSYPVFRYDSDNAPVFQHNPCPHWLIT